MKKQTPNLIAHWASISSEIEAETYQGGLPGRPLFSGFSKEEKLAYCEKMINNIKNSKD